MISVIRIEVQALQGPDCATNLRNLISRVQSTRESEISLVRSSTCHQQHQVLASVLLGGKCSVEARHGLECATANLYVQLYKESIF